MGRGSRRTMAKRMETPQMKITKAQIQKMIKEELQALEERQDQFGSSISQRDPGDSAPERRNFAAEREEDERRSELAARKGAEEAAAFEKEYGEINRINADLAAKALRDSVKPPRGSVDQVASGINKLYTQGSDKEHYQSYGNVPNIVALFIQDQQKNTKDPKIRYQNFEDLRGSLKKELGNVAPYGSPKGRGGGKITFNEEDAAKDAIKAGIRQLGTEIRAIENKVEAGMVSMNQAAAQQRQGFIGGALGKAKDFFGLEEDLTLTSEELQQIINEEFENVTKGK